MKRFVRLVCVLVVFSVLIAIPAYAEEQSTRASSFFSAYRAYCTKTSTTSLSVYFQVIGVGIMDELGASQIKVQKSSDGENWTTVKTFSKASNSGLIDDDTGYHSATVSCTISSGYYYRAVVTLYGKNSAGTGYKTYYTAKV